MSSMRHIKLDDIMAFGPTKTTAVTTIYPPGHEPSLPSSPAPPPGPSPELSPPAWELTPPALSGGKNQLIPNKLRQVGNGEADQRHDELINHPAHYNSLGACCPGCGRPIECIDVISKMDWVKGSIIKYLWRAGLKGAAIEDLKKAEWLIKEFIKKLES